MQTRSQTRQKNEKANPVIQEAMRLSFSKLKIEPLTAARSENDIKQEDVANTETKNEQTATSFNETFINTNATIKMEPTDVSLKQQTESKHASDLRDGTFYYSCRSCNQRSDSLKSMLDHRKQVHNISRRKNCPIKHITLEPDVDDANHYCLVCEKHFNTRALYQRHLIGPHHMVIIKSNKQRSRQRNDAVLIDAETSKDSHAQSIINKFNHYCKPCQRFYCSQTSYEEHVFAKHSSPSTLLQSSTTTQPTADTYHSAHQYCFVCNKRISKDYFKLHTTLLHSTHTPPLYNKKSSVLQPQVNEPNHYCSVCQQKFDSKSMYHNHLQDVHNMALQCLAPKDPRVLPNPRNRCNYCRVCKKTMTSRVAYRLHCKYSHFMTLEKLGGGGWRSKTKSAR